MDEQSFNLPNNVPIQGEKSNLPLITPQTNIPPIPLSSTPTVTVSFFDIVKKTLAIFKKRAGTFIVLALLNIIIIVAFYVLSTVFILGLIFKIGFVGFALLALPALLAVFISWIFYGTISNQAAATLYGLTTRLGESFSLSFKNIGKALLLSFRIFIFTGAWTIIIIPVLTTIVNASLSSLGGFFLVILNFGIAGASIVIIIISIIRSIYATMAFPVLTAQPQTSTKEALAHSKKISKGKWWTIWLNLTAFTFLTSIIPIILNLISAIFGNGTFTLITLIITGIISLIAYPLTACFFQVFLGELSNESIKFRIDPTVIVLTISVIALPLIMPFVTPQKNLNNLPIEQKPVQTAQTEEKEVKTKQDVSSQSSSTDKVGIDDDTATLSYLKTWKTAIDSYLKENKSGFVLQTGCLDESFQPNQIKNYFTDKQFPTYSGNAKVSGSYLGKNLKNCSHAFQNFNNGNYVLYTSLKDSSQNNIDNIFQHLLEAMTFTPKTGGKMYAEIYTSPDTNLADLKSQAVKDDAARMDHLNKAINAFEAYKKDNGVYPEGLSCISSRNIKNLDKYYLDNNSFHIIPDSIPGLYIEGTFKAPGIIYTIGGCPEAYQYLGDDSYAVYVAMQDKTKNNIDHILQSLDEAKKFQPSNGGTYFVIIRLANTPLPLFSAPNGTQIKAPRVKRSVSILTKPISQF